MKDTNKLWRQAQKLEEEHQFEKAAEIYLKAAQIDLKNGKMKAAASGFNEGGNMFVSCWKTR